MTRNTFVSKSTTFVTFGPLPLLVAAVQILTRKMMLPVVKIQIWKRAKDGVPGTHNDQRPSEESRGGIPFDEKVIGSSVAPR